MDRLLELLARYSDLTDDERAELSTLLDAESEDYALADATPEQIAEVEETLVALFDEADDEDSPDVDAMEELSGHVESVRGEAIAREAAAEADRSRADEIRNRVRGEQAEDETEEPEASTEEETETEVEETEEETETEAVAAAGSPARRAARNRNPRRAPRPADAPSATAIVAAAETGFEAGARINFADLGEALAHRTETLLASSEGGKRLAGSRYSAGRVLLDYPDEFSLGRDPVVNRQRLDAAVSPESIVAAGGLCRTPDVDYDLPGVESAARPLRDALPRFGATRGGIRVLPTPTLSSITDGVTVWTEENDGAENPDPATKPVFVIDCGEEETTFVHAVPARMQIGNFQRQFFPELWTRNMTLMQAAHARLAENTLWDNMVAEATAVTHAEALGAARDFLTGLERAVAAFLHRHRIAEGVRIDWFVPRYVRNIIRMDLTRQLPGDDVMNVTDEQIDAMIRARGVNPIYSFDGGTTTAHPGAQGAGAMLDLPTEIETIFAPTGTFVFLDGGQIDLGAEIRDTTLIGTNDVQWFYETFEGVYRNGVEAHATTFTVCPSGESVGTVEGIVCGGS